MTPVDDLPQHEIALRKANSVRIGKAALKRELRDGATTIADALDDERAQAAPIHEILTAQRYWGDRRAALALREAGILDHNRRVRDLTARQRREIIVAAGIRDRRAAIGSVA